MRVKAPQTNEVWIFSRNILFALAFMLYVFEWHYARNGAVVNGMPVYLSYPGYMGGPLLVLLAFVSGMGRYMAPIRQTIFSILFLYAGTLVSLFAHQFILYEYSTETSKFELIQLFMMPIFAIFGLILGSNIENVTVVDQDDRVCVDLITLTVKDRNHLAKVMRRLKELSIVIKITRVKG